jgi:hypothetical protein
MPSIAFYGLDEAGEGRRDEEQEEERRAHDGYERE